MPHDDEPPPTLENVVLDLARHVAILRAEVNQITTILEHVTENLERLDAKSREHEQRLTPSSGGSSIGQNTP